MTNDLDAGSDSWATSVIFALFGLLIRPMMRRQLHKELVALKSLLEGRWLASSVSQRSVVLTL